MFDFSFMCFSYWNNHFNPKLMLNPGNIRADYLFFSEERNFQTYLMPRQENTWTLNLLTAYVTLETYTTCEEPVFLLCYFFFQRRKTLLFAHNPIHLAFSFFSHKKPHSFMVFLHFHIHKVNVKPYKPEIDSQRKHESHSCGYTNYPLEMIKFIFTDNFPTGTGK